jgi:anti-anti-sigma regulatory factor
VPSDGRDHRAAGGSAPCPGTSARVLALAPPVTHADVADACERLRVLLQDGGSAGITVICDLAAITAPDALALEVLARLQLTARRLGGQISLCRPSGRLRELLVLTGLAEFLPLHEGHRIDQVKD